MRTLGISRDEGELLVDLLMLSDHHCAASLEAEIRALFGMRTRDSELTYCGKSIAQMRTEFARSIIESDTSDGAPKDQSYPHGHSGQSSRA